MKLTNQSALFQSLVIISSLKFLYEIVFRRKRWLRAFYQTNMDAQSYDKNFTQKIIFARERLVRQNWTENIKSLSEGHNLDESGYHFGDLSATRN